jgi:very-short-patch-repair endonuclease
MGSGRSSRGLGLAHSCGMDKAEVFLDLWRWICPNLPLPIREFRFSKRRFRFDFAFPDRKVAVEIEGGGWLYGRHHRPKGYERDLEKYNLAQSLGWKVFGFTPQMLENDPDGCVGMVLGALGWEKAGRREGARKKKSAAGAGGDDG